MTKALPLLILTVALWLGSSSVIVSGELYAEYTSYKLEYGKKTTYTDDGTYRALLYK